jgi:Mg2+ and Co2+ transporter CorA
MDSGAFVKVAKEKALSHAKKHGWKVRPRSIDHEWMDRRDLAVWFDVKVASEAEARKILKQAGCDKDEIDDIIANDFLAEEI